MQGMSSGDVGQLVRRPVRRRQAVLRQLRHRPEVVSRRCIPRSSVAGGPEAGVPARSAPAALVGERLRATFRLEGRPERHAPGNDLPGRLDVHDSRRLHADRSGDRRRRVHVPSTTTWRSRSSRPGIAGLVSSCEIERPRQRADDAPRRSTTSSETPPRRRRPERSRRSTPASPPCGATSAC